MPDSSLEPFREFMARMRAHDAAWLAGKRAELESLRQRVIVHLLNAEARGDWKMATHCRELLAEIESPTTRALFGGGDA